MRRLLLMLVLCLWAVPVGAQPHIVVEPTQIRIGTDTVPRFLNLPVVLTVPVGTEATLPADSTWDYIEVAGTLHVSRTRNTVVRFTHLFVLPGGVLDVGTAADPLPATNRVEFIIRDVSIDTSRDPFQWGNGLLNFGAQTRYGAAKLEWTTLTAGVATGATTVTLAADPTGWAVGDEVLIPDTNFAGPSRESTVTVAGIMGRTVTLSKPLDFAHPAQTDPDGGIVLLPRIANLTRNIVVRSENPAGTRGHTADVGHDAAWTIAYNEFSGLGRTKADPLDSLVADPPHIGTNQVGRYTDHHHHAHGLGSLSRGNVLRGSGQTVGKWGLVLHGTHDATIERNIAIGFSGAGFVTEDGYEVRNVFRQNFSAYNVGLGSHNLMQTENNIVATNPGSEGSGFWLRGVMGTLDGNEAWDNTVGINLVNIRPVPGSYPSVPGGVLDTPLVTANMTPITVMDNVTASNHVFGFEYWGTPKFPNINLISTYNENAATVITISNFLYPYLVNPTLLSKDGRSIGVHTSTSYTGQLDIEGGKILGNRIGILDGGAQQLRVTGTTFQNAIDFDLESPPSNFMVLTDVLNTPLPGFPQKSIVFGSTVVWSGVGPFPISGRDAWKVQRGSRHVIKNWQRHPGEDYQLFEAQQLASTAAFPSSTEHKDYCPSEVTMGQCWSLYGVSFAGEALADAEAVHLDGLVNGLARAGSVSLLGPPRLVITYPTTRAAAVVVDGQIPVVGLVTGMQTGLAPEHFKVSIDGGPLTLIGSGADWDLRIFSLPAGVEGLHEIKTWRIDAATLAIVPASLMTFQYAVGSAPLPTTCQNPAATNFGGSLPCVFPPPPVQWALIAQLGPGVVLERFGTTDLFRLNLNGHMVEFQMK